MKENSSSSNKNQRGKRWKRRNICILSSTLKWIKLQKNSLIMDNGASHHIKWFRDKFESFEGYSSEEVTIGDNSTHPVKGNGSCSIQLNLGITPQLKNILFGPSIKRNLVSIFGLSDQGYWITFQEDKILSWPKNWNIKKAITIGFRDGSLFRLLTNKI